MPTGEFKQLLDREFSKASVKPITDITTPLLRELVDFGLTAFRRCDVEAAGGRENEDLTALVLYRHLIEMLDGIEVLVAHCCGTAAIPLLRSEFEASLALSYLLKDDALYVQRSLSWLVANVHFGIKARRVLEPGTDSGKNYVRLYEEEFGRVLSSVPNAAIAAEIAGMERGLQSVQFAAVEAEYQRTKRLGRPTDWFALFDGPTNRAELAEHLGRGAEYRLFYGDWSSLGHASDMSRYLSSLQGKAAFDAVRRPDELQQVSLLAAMLMLRATRDMIGKFRKGESLEAWYLRDVKPLSDSLGELKIAFTALPQP